MNILWKNRSINTGNRTNSNSEPRTTVSYLQFYTISDSSPIKCLFAVFVMLKLQEFDFYQYKNYLIRFRTGYPLTILYNPFCYMFKYIFFESFISNRYKHFIWQEKKKKNIFMLELFTGLCCGMMPYYVLYSMRIVNSMRSTGQLSVQNYNGITLGYNWACFYSFSAYFKQSFDLSPFQLSAVKFFLAFFSSSTSVFIYAFSFRNFTENKFDLVNLKEEDAINEQHKLFNPKGETAHTQTKVSKMAKLIDKRFYTYFYHSSKFNIFANAITLWMCDAFHIL